MPDRAAIKVVRGCIELGVVRPQAVLLSPEMDKVVVREDNLESVSREGKPTLCAGRKAAVLGSETAEESGDYPQHTTGVVEQGMCT